MSKLNKPKLNKNFKSDLDIFLEKFDKQHPEHSPSQLAEIKKYSQINQLRDSATSPENSDTIWELF